MSVANNRRREPGKAGNETLLLVFAVTLIVAVAITWASVAAGSAIAHVNPRLPRDPISIITGLLRHQIAWPPASTIVAAGILTVLAAISVWVLWLRRASTGGDRFVIDRQARFMATGRQLAHLTGKQALATSTRLGVEGSSGIPLGRTVVGGQAVYASFEDMITVVAGPRVGKSTSLVIPAVIAAPGAVVTTSNKRDVLDATRDLRAGRGQVWVFDPQAVARENAAWWWNPLSYVTDDTRAAKLAQHFATGSRAAGAVTDAFFDGAGQNLLAGLLLAAAVAGRPIRQVHAWLVNPTDEEPVTLLRSAGHEMTADGLLGVIQSADRLRDSVYSTAQEMAACLKNSAVADWVNRRDTDTRPQFSPTRFARSSDTLFSLSKEGAGTAGPLVTALTAATLEAATDLADVSPGGRLSTPLVAVLDEAANVCRWRDLPDLYSHFGSRGIPIMSVFQSWSQGVAVFTREGMLKLWSASNAFLYLGSVRETEFLKNLADLIGDYDRETVTANLSRGVRSTSSALRRDRILDVDELAALPRGRAVLLTTGARAALLATTPWHAGSKPIRDAIAASIAAHDPAVQRAPRAVVPQLPVAGDPTPQELA